MFGNRSGRDWSTGTALAVLVCSLLSVFLPDQELSAADRVPWTTGTVTGSPDPPPAFRTALRYPKLKFRQPLLIRTDAKADRIWICEQNGRVFSFEDDRNVAAPDLFLDLQADFDKLVLHATAKRIGAVYGLAFHPRYPEVPYC